MNCSGKHRELSMQYSFVRSLTLDGWNRRQIAFMEHGGNARALEYIRRNNLRQGDTSAIDTLYKSSAMQKYKTEMIKYVDGLLNLDSGAAQKTEPTKVVHPHVAVSTEKATPLVEKEPHSANPRLEETKANPFAAVSANKVSFQVNFQKDNKGATNSGQKAQVKAKKIDDIDFSALMLDDNMPPAAAKTEPEPKHHAHSMSEGGHKTNAVEAPSKQISFAPPAQASKDTDFKKFQSAKAISSDMFFHDERADSQRMDKGKFQGQNAISSAQYFGEEEPEEQSSLGEGLKNFLFKTKEKVETLKGKAQTMVAKWQRNVDGNE
eukprot:TRINITY_DN1313_c0_g1_i3.p1 TRINITY_DN1313_c0_g1~~TRINITY_DN1313_c0_g1_i3.p1  ORF type:complete len:321 (+),score=82.63 TRINITY_DN1313_c0_g1_i3:240-1202(+)